MTKLLYKSVLLLTVLILSTHLYAQDNTDQASQGYDWVVGGTANLSTSSLPGSDDNNTRLSLRPYIGKQVSAHWIIGAQVSYRYSQIPRFFGPGGTVELAKENAFGGGLWGRYTFNPQNRLQAFLQPEVFGVSSTTKIEDATFTSESDEFEIGASIGIGAAFNISPRVRLLANFGGMSFSRFTESETSSFNFSINPERFALGAEYRF